MDFGKYQDCVKVFILIRIHSISLIFNRYLLDIDAKNMICLIHITKKELFVLIFHHILKNLVGLI